jgi:hypothetical protein
VDVEVSRVEHQGRLHPDRQFWPVGHASCDEVRDGGANEDASERRDYGSQRFRLSGMPFGLGRALDPVETPSVGSKAVRSGHLRSTVLRVESAICRQFGAMRGDLAQGGWNPETVLQAGGHRFDPGTLHTKSPANRILSEAGLLLGLKRRVPTDVRKARRHDARAPTHRLSAFRACRRPTPSS